jgi:hypothetical protein
MPSFTVLTADKIKDGQGTKGPFTVWKLGLKNGDGNEPSVAEMFCPFGMSPPAVGSTVEGTIEKTDNPSWLDKFKPVRQGGGGGGPRPEDPKRAKRILRQHSQTTALATLDMLDRWNLLGDDAPKSREDFFTLLKSLMDWLDKDAETAGERA